MTDYVKTTNFTAKDALSSGDPNKVIKGSEHDTEFTNIAAMSETKANKVASATADNLAKLQSTGDLSDAGYRFAGLTGAITLYSGDNSLGFPSGTKMLFQQTTAPTGWTKITTGVNDKALRVVSGTVGSGGTDAFSTVFSAAKATESHILTIAEMPSHDHSPGAISNGAHTHALSATFAIGGGTSGAFDNTSPNGDTSGAITALSNGAHTHTITAQGGDGGHTHDITMDVQYLDVIIASKD